MLKSASEAQKFFEKAVLFCRGADICVSDRMRSHPILLPQGVENDRKIAVPDAHGKRGGTAAVPLRGKGAFIMREKLGRAALLFF